MDIIKYLFGPLEKNKFCVFFLVLTIIGFVLLFGSIMLLLYNIFNKSKTVSFFNNILTIGFYFAFYLQSRILYSVCMGSI